MCAIKLLYFGKRVFLQYCEELVSAWLIIMIVLCPDVYLRSLQYNNKHCTILLYTERYDLKNNTYKIHINTCHDIVGNHLIPFMGLQGFFARANPRAKAGYTLSPSHRRALTDGNCTSEVQGFSILLKDTSTCSSAGSRDLNQQPSNH